MGEEDKKNQPIGSESINLEDFDTNESNTDPDEKNYVLPNPNDLFDTTSVASSDSEESVASLGGGITLRKKKGSNNEIPCSYPPGQSLDKYFIEEKLEELRREPVFNNFRLRLDALICNNEVIKDDCRINKRLLDLKYSHYKKRIDIIQICIIIFSTLSAFLQATKEYIMIPEMWLTFASIIISTGISLVLSIAKFRKYDELKERTHNLREQYAELNNKIEYRQDKLGPWTNDNLWLYIDIDQKLKEWGDVEKEIKTDFAEILKTKQGLFTEFDKIMDTKNRNNFKLKNKKILLENTIKNLKYEKERKNFEKTYGTSINIPNI
jgi:hypothetical protein